ncbi:hypothetical protein ACIBVL_41795 [Streptomyces sp. NPDC049687]|uniref:hypothetical protein n=1 Tax=Streptomyces sp. NPDC049687 TaxID=3365596 RepID=UPI00378D7BF2
MSHVDPAYLVELALGNATPTTADDAALHHVAECTRCRDDLHMMTRVVEAVRTAELIDLPSPPPERVWRGIARNLSREPETPGPPPRPPHAQDHRKRALLTLLALAAAAAIAAAGVIARARVGDPRRLRLRRRVLPATAAPR